MAVKKTQAKPAKKDTKMAIKKAEIKLSEMMPAELITTVKELREKIALANMEKVAGKAKNIKLAYSLKKQLARTLTILKEKSHA